MSLPGLLFDNQFDSDHPIIMRIGLLIYGGLDTVSGGYLYDRMLAAYLQSQGDKVEIISLPWRNYPSHLGDNLSPALARRLRQLQVDILLQDELNHPSLFWLNQRLRGKLPYPIVTIVHHLRSSEEHPNLLKGFYRRVEEQYLHSVDGFIFNSQTTREVVAGAGINLEALPYVVAKPAADHLDPTITEVEITHRSKKDGPLELLFVGNLIPRKGLDTLLGALKQLPPEIWRLTVVGSLSADKKYTESIRRQLKDPRLAENVRLTGTLENDALIAQFKSSHLLVAPSSYEGFGIVYLEGMGFGLPAIAGEDGGAAEIITSGVNGFLVPTGDSAIIKEYLNTLAASREQLLAMSYAARERFLAHPTWEQCGEQIRRFLQDLV